MGSCLPDGGGITLLQYVHRHQPNQPLYTSQTALHTCLEANANLGSFEEEDENERSSSFSKDKFSFKFRRRSKSAPRTSANRINIVNINPSQLEAGRSHEVGATNRKSNEAAGHTRRGRKQSAKSRPTSYKQQRRRQTASPESPITYTANGERVRCAKASPGQVELVGFVNYSAHDADDLSAASGRLALNSDYQRQRIDLLSAASVNSLLYLPDNSSGSGHNFGGCAVKTSDRKTSADVKMERERQRQERLKSGRLSTSALDGGSSYLHGDKRRHCSTGWSTAKAHNNEVLKEEHNRFLQEAKQRLDHHSNNRILISNNNNNMNGNNHPSSLFSHNKNQQNNNNNFTLYSRGGESGSSPCGGARDQFLTQFLREREERLARFTSGRLGGMGGSNQLTSAFLNPPPSPSLRFSSARRRDEEAEKKESAEEERERRVGVVAGGPGSHTASSLLSDSPKGGDGVSESGHGDPSAAQPTKRETKDEPQKQGQADGDASDQGKTKLMSCGDQHHCEPELCGGAGSEDAASGTRSQPQSKHERVIPIQILSEPMRASLNDNVTNGENNNGDSGGHHGARPEQETSAATGSASAFGHGFPLFNGSGSNAGAFAQLCNSRLGMFAFDQNVDFKSSGPGAMFPQGFRESFPGFSALSANFSSLAGMDMLPSGFFGDRTNGLPSATGETTAIKMRPRSGRMGVRSAARSGFPHSRLGNSKSSEFGSDCYNRFVEELEDENFTQSESEASEDSDDDEESPESVAVTVDASGAASQRQRNIGSRLPYDEDEDIEEEEEEEEELDSVSVFADRSGRDRLSGTSSTHSGTGASCDDSSTLSSVQSADSGIVAEELHLSNSASDAVSGSTTLSTTSRGESTSPSGMSSSSGHHKRGSATNGTANSNGGLVVVKRRNDVTGGSNGGSQLNGGARRRSARPISAVPSEYSDISTNSAEGSDDKNFNDKSFNHGDQSFNSHDSSCCTTDQRPLVVTKTPLSPSEGKDGKLEKAYFIANELLSTEIHYVSRLHLIDQVFHFRVDQENRNSNMFPQETVTTIFSNIKSIYKFHAEFLLPQLKDRMESWESSPDLQKIGDIMMRNAPFLKMYTEYVKNFDTAMAAINTHYAKNSKFAAIMDDIHRMTECGNLSLQHHMLSPIQRIPRYELLLRDYINSLPQHHPDRTHAQSALKQVSQAAAHANDSMKRIEQFKKLLEVQESIAGSIDLVSPTRELIKEGRIVKISARTGDHQERYLFLLSDLLLLCSVRKAMISTGPQYALRARFDVDNLKVMEGDNLVTPNTFYVRDDHKTVELYTGTNKEKEDWINAFHDVIKSLYTRKSSLRVGREILRPLDCEIGKKQPHMQRLDNVSKCADCGVQFSILKHKHNCRTCGAVFCSKCSDFKYPLPWEDGRKGRICRACNSVLSNANQIQPTIELSVRPRGLLEVSAATKGVHRGWLVLKHAGGGPSSRVSSPAKRYFVLLSDFVLYSFRTEEDGRALTATPLPGFTLLAGGQLKGDSNAGAEKDRDKVFKMVNAPSKRTYYFAGTSAKEVERWVEVLSLASKAELPPEDNLDLVSDTKSTSSTEYENS